MKSKGRPPTKPIQFRDGFYIEVRNKGSKDRGVKIHCLTKEIMENTIKQYTRNNKEITILGEHKDFEWADSKKTPKLAKAAKASKAPLISQNWAVQD